MSKVKHMVRTSAPVGFMRRISRRVSLPGFKGLPVYDVYGFLKQQMKKTGLGRRAKAIAFDFAMAIPALLICILTLVPYMPVSHEFETQLLQVTRTISPNQSTYKAVASFLNDFLHQPRVGLLSFSFVLVIFYASNAMLSIIRTFDYAIYGQKKTGNFIKRRIKAMRLTVIVLLLFIATLLLSIGQGMVFHFIITRLKLKGSDVVWISAVKWLVIVALFFYSVAFIYRYAPSVKKRWRMITPGSVLATSLMLATTIVFSYWVNHFNNFNKIYGSLGTIMILMLLIYLNSLILLLGFELNLSISFLKADADKQRESSAGKNNLQKQQTK